MKKLTKKYIFEQKLKDKPIYIHVNKISNNEIQCLIDCGVVKQLAQLPRKLDNLAIVIAKYPIMNVIPTRNKLDESISYEHKYVPPDRGMPDSMVRLRNKSFTHK